MAIEQFNPGKLFFSCKGISLDEGLTDADEMISESHRIMMKKADEVILLCDSSKFGKTSLSSLGEIDLFNMIITDSKLQKKYADEVRKRDIELVIAE